MLKYPQLTATEINLFLQRIEKLKKLKPEEMLYILEVLHSFKGIKIKLAEANITCLSSPNGNSAEYEGLKLSLALTTLLTRPVILKTF